MNSNLFTLLTCSMLMIYVNGHSITFNSRYNAITIDYSLYNQILKPTQFIFASNNNIYSFRNQNDILCIDNTVEFTHNPSNAASSIKETIVISVLVILYFWLIQVLFF